MLYKLTAIYLYINRYKWNMIWFYHNRGNLNAHILFIPNETIMFLNEMIKSPMYMQIQMDSFGKVTQLCCLQSMPFISKHATCVYMELWLFSSFIVFVCRWIGVLSENNIILMTTQLFYSLNKTFMQGFLHLNSQLTQRRKKTYFSHSWHDTSLLCGASPVWDSLQMVSIQYAIYEWSLMRHHFREQPQRCPS